MILFASLIAFMVAKLEIQIEGKEGWAKHLPTYRFKNWFSRIFLGEYEMTGYHVWLNTTLMTFAHFPFFVGISWSFALEFKILGVFFIAAALEDLFWFIMNPEFGIRKFSKQYVPWFRWFGFLPTLHIFYISLASIFLFLSVLVSNA